MTFRELEGAKLKWLAVGAFGFSLSFWLVWLIIGAVEAIDGSLLMLIFIPWQILVWIMGHLMQRTGKKEAEDKLLRDIKRDIERMKRDDAD